MKAIVTNILTSVFEKYINPIKDYQFDYAIWQGNAKLQNVTIKSTALSSHDFPFTITSGIIKSISLHFPWNAINSMPCEIEIDGIDIIACFTKEIEINSDIKIKETYLKELEDACDGNEKSQQSILGGIFSIIIDNIVFNIRNVHLQIELLSKTLESKMIIGVMLDSCECYTVNDKGEKAFVNSSNIKLRKKINVQGFSIYINSNIKDNDFHKEDYDFLLHTFSFSSIFTRTRNDYNGISQTHSEFSNQIDDLDLDLNQNQIQVLKEFQYQNNMFNLRQKYFRCGRPSSLPRSQRSSGKWWRYIHRCTIEKRYPNRLRISDIIQMLKTRETYSQLWNVRLSMPIEDFKATEHHAILKQIEGRLSLSTIIFLRSYSEYIQKSKLHPDKKSSIKFNTNELESLMLKNSSLSSFHVSLSLKSASLKIFEGINKKEHILTLKFEKINGMYTKNLEKEMNSSFTCDMLNFFTPIQSVFIKQSGSFTENPNNSPMVTFSYKSFPLKLEKEIEVNVNYPLINIDFQLYRKLKAIFISNTVYYISENKNEENLSLQKKCEGYPYVKLNVSLLNSIIILNNSKLQYNCKSATIESFPIHNRSINNFDSLYTKYEVKIIDFSVIHNALTIVNPFSTSFKYYSLIVPIVSVVNKKFFINISEISINASKSSYDAIVEMFLNALNYQNMNDKKGINQDHNNQITKSNQLNNISPKYILFNLDKLHLSLDSIGEFEIYNLFTSFSIMPNSTDINFKIANLKCTGIKNDYISLTNESILKGTIHTNDDVNSFNFKLTHSSILVDFEWLEKCQSFFNSTNISIIDIFRKPKEKELNVNIEKNILNKPSRSYEIEISIEKSSFFLIVPTIFNSYIKFSAFPDAIIYKTDEFHLTNISFLIDNRKISDNVSISFKKSIQNIFTINNAILDFEESDYYLLLGAYEYIIYKYNFHFNKSAHDSQKKVNIRENIIDIPKSIINIKGKFSIDIDNLQINLIDELNLKINLIKVKELFFHQTAILSSNFSLIKNGNNFTIDLSNSSLFQLNPQFLHFLHHFFLDDIPRPIQIEKSVHLKKKLTFHISLYSPNIVFDQIGILESKKIELQIEKFPEHHFDFNLLFQNIKILNSDDKNEILFQSINSEKKEDNEFDVLFKFSKNEEKKAVKLKCEYVSFLSNWIKIAKLKNFFSEAISDRNNKNKSSSITVPHYLYDINIEKIDLFSRDKALQILIHSFAIQTNLQDNLNHLLKCDHIIFLFKKSSFVNIENILFNIHLIADNHDFDGKKASLSMISAEFNCTNAFFDHKFLIDHYGTLFPLLESFTNKSESPKKDSNDRIYNLNYKIEGVVNTLVFSFKSIQELSFYNIKYIFKKIEKLNFHDLTFESLNIASLPTMIQKYNDNLLKLNLESNSLECDIGNALINFDFKTIPVILNFIDEIKTSPLKLIKSEENNNIKDAAISIKINLINLKINLIKNITSLNLELFGSLILCNNDFNFLLHLSASFIVKERMFEPLINNFFINIYKSVDELSLSFSNCKCSISPDDIIDLRSFYKRIKQIYQSLSNNSYKYSSLASNQNHNETIGKVMKVIIKTDDINILFCEDNRSTIIPFPFLRLKTDALNFAINVGRNQNSNIIFDIENIQTEIFNKKTQKWDIFFEPTGFEVCIESQEKINIFVLNRLNFVLSNQSLKQLLQFSFKKNGFQNKPEYIVENNTSDILTISYQDIPDKTDNMLSGVIQILPEKSIEIYDTRSFKLCNSWITPQKYFFPQFLTENFSISIINKGSTRVLSINSPILFNNKSNTPLIFQGLTPENKRIFVSIYPNKSSPLSVKIIDKFYIYGENPINEPKQLSIKKLKERGRIIHPIFVGKQTIYFIISLKFSLRRGIIVIRILPRFTIHNHLPIPLQFCIPKTNISIQVKANSKEYMNQYDDINRNVIYLFLRLEMASNNIVNTKVAYLDLNDNSNSEIPIYFSTNAALSVLLNNSTISIKPPMMIRNQTNIAINVFDSEDHSFGQALNGYEKIIGTNDYFEKKNICLKFQVDNYNISKVIEIKDEKILLFLQSKIFDELYLPLLLYPSYNRNKTKILNIYYAIKVYNFTNNLISLQPLDNSQEVYGPALFLEPQDPQKSINQLSGKPIMLSSKHLKFFFSSELSEKSIELPLNINYLQTIHSTIALDDENKILIEVEFQLIKNEYILTFKNASFQQPYILTNLLDDVPIIFIPNYQRNCAKKVINPMSTTFLFFKSITNTSFKLLISNKEYDFDFPKAESTVKFDIFYMENKSIGNGRNLIIISKCIEKNVKIRQLNIMLTVPQLSISLVDNKMFELALLTLMNASFIFNRNNTIDSFSFNIDEIQIDDMQPFAPVPVILYNKTAPFLSCIITKNDESNNSFREIFIKTSDLTIYIDLNFVSDLIHFYKSIMNEYIGSNQKKEPNIIHDLISINHLNINEFTFDVSLVSNSGRFLIHDYEIDNLPKYIPKISHIDVKLKPFILKEISVNKNYLISLTLDHYKQCFFNNIYKMIIKVPIEIARSASDALHSFTSTKTSIYTPVNSNKTTKDAVKQGFKSLGKSFSTGLTGIFEEPKKGYNESGAGGLLGGIVRGTLGAILQPVAGAIDLTTSVVDGIANISQDIRKPIRIPRVFNNNQIIPLNKRVSLCQLNFQKEIRNYQENFIYFITARTVIVGISQNFFVVFSRNDNFKIKARRKLSSVKRILCEKFLLRIVFADNNNQMINEIIECENEDVAKMAVRVIYSRCCVNNFILNM